VASEIRVAQNLVSHLVSRGFSCDSVGFDVPPFGFESDKIYSSDLANRIREHRTTHLFMGVGAPKSELWVYVHRGELGDCYALCVGAALDFFAGEKRRAPVWMQTFGLEWVWRLLHEPGRLFRRYLINSWAFLAAIGRDLMARVR